jgi:hypothetical protein
VVGCLVLKWSAEDTVEQYPPFGASQSVSVVGWGGSNGHDDGEAGTLQPLDLFQILVSDSQFCYVVLCICCVRVTGNKHLCILCTMTKKCKKIVLTVNSTSLKNMRTENHSQR